jgi:hypothetical protein
MEIQINGNQIIEKLEQRLSQEIHKNIVLEATIDVLKEELKQISTEQTLKIE